MNYFLGLHQLESGYLLIGTRSGVPQDQESVLVTRLTPGGKIDRAYRRNSCFNCPSNC